MKDLHRTASTYHNQMKSAGLQDYWIQHGLSEKVIDEFMLGWVLEPLSPEHEPFSQAPVVPYLRPDNRVLLMRAHTFESEMTGDYVTGIIGSDIPFVSDGMHLFNPAHLIPGLRSDHCYIVDDVKSAIRLRELGERACAVPGFDRWKRPWTELCRSSTITLIGSETKREQLVGMYAMFSSARVDFRYIELPAQVQMWQALDAGMDLDQLHYYKKSGVADDV